MERKINGQQAEYDKTLNKIKTEKEQLEERHDTVKKMNIMLQKKLKSASDKASQYDNVLARCIQLETTNNELLKMMTNHESLSTAQMLA